MSVDFHKRFAVREAAALKGEIEADIADRLNDIDEKIEEIEARLDTLEGYHE